VVGIGIGWFSGKGDMLGSPEIPVGKFLIEFLVEQAYAKYFLPVFVKFASKELILFLINL
jgi:hypothetical protein